jgi:hypothetical protein
MAIKHRCKEIWDLWGEGWICIPTSPYHPSDKFSSELGRFLVSKFPGLEKNYGRLCEVGRGEFALFRSTETRGANPKRFLSYNDLRMPLSPGDYGIILIPDSSSSEIDKKTAKTDWEVIEESISLLKENKKIIPGKIFLPPLGFGEGRLEEQEAVDDLMATLLDFDEIEIVYNISIETKEEKEEEETSNTETDEQKEDKKESVDIYSSEESNEEWNGENLIDDEFDRIEVRLPDDL